jgi:epoxyqueuosine reductase
MTTTELHQLAQDIKLWASELGFDQAGITDTDLTLEEPRLQAWLDAGHHGSMDYMARHGMMRARPHELLPGTLRVLSVRMNYLPFEAGFAATLRDPTLGYISRYALGRDYHKLLRNRLKQLGERIEQRCEALGWRAPSSTRPPFWSGRWRPRALAGWASTRCCSTSRRAPSSFWELLLSLPLPLDAPVEKEQCGKCVACINICPTGAIIAPTWWTDVAASPISPSRTTAPFPKSSGRSWATASMAVTTASSSAPGTAMPTPARSPTSARAPICIAHRC